MTRIHDRNTRPFPPSGCIVSIRDTTDDNRTFYAKGIVRKVSRRFVVLAPGCKVVNVEKKNNPPMIWGDVEFTWYKSEDFKMIVVESADEWSEWDDVDTNDETRLRNIGGSDFSDYFLSEVLSDFKILCEDVTFNCHKIVLAAGSPVFEAAVNSNMLEAKTGCLKIEDCKPNVVKFILESIYKSQVDIKTLKEDPAFTREVLIAADKYRLEKLKDLAEKELCIQIGMKNALELLVVGDMHGAAKLRKSAQELIIKKKNDIVNLNQDDFRQFIRNYPDLSFEILKLL